MLGGVSVRRVDEVENWPRKELIDRDPQRPLPGRVEPLEVAVRTRHAEKLDGDIEEAFEMNG